MAASLDLGFDDAQQAIAGALAQFCAERCPDEVVKSCENRLPEDLWRALGELGVLALVTPEGDGGATEMVAALESLGRAVFPGPLPATFFATQLVGEAERRALLSGETLVALGAPPLLPWAPVAGLFIEVRGGRAARARPQGVVEPVETLGGEPWGRVRLETLEDLGPTARAQAVYDIALAAYVAGAGARLVGETAEHARTRKQFGRPIGEFQAVAHPLADCHTALAGAGTLARAAAFYFDESDESDESDEGAAGPEGGPGSAGSVAPEVRAWAAAARLSACRAAVEAAHTSHQLFGALGITLEGPVFHVSRRIRQLASQPPGDGPARAALLARYAL